MYLLYNLIMNNFQSNDDKLFEFFYDLKNIESMAENYPSLQKFKDECLDILNSKRYSSINVKDEKGNTFLHYAFEHINFGLVNSLLNMGADPSIKNNKERNCFQMPIAYGAIYKFWKQYDRFYFDKDYFSKTKDYCDNFKQILFNHLFEKQLTQFKSTQEIDTFLNNNNFYTQDNKLKLLIISLMIKDDDKMTYFLSNFSDPSQNSLMLCSVIDKHGSVFFRDLKNQKQIYEFFSRDFEINDDFLVTAGKIINRNKNNFILRGILNILVDKNFPIKTKINLSNQSLKDDLEKNPISKSIYQFLDLEKNMSSKIETRKILKI